MERFVAALLLTLTTAVAQTNAPTLWGRLKPGPYAVGHTLSFTADKTRIDEVDPGKTPSTKPRPILLAIWYPAREPVGVPLRYQQYSQIPPHSDYPNFATRLAEFSRTTATEIMFRNRKGVPTPLAFPAAAYRDPQPATGTFPLVLYHPGAEGSFDDNTLLFEFLASHGYVVISSAYQFGTVLVSNNIDMEERSIKDLAFLHTWSATLPNADTNNSAAIGHSAGAQRLLEWIGRRNCPLKAAALLDTTLEYTPENFPGHSTLRRTLSKGRPPTIATLVAASGDRNPDFKTVDSYLRQADRYLLTTSGLRHDDYLTQGLMRAFVPESKLTERQRRDLKEGYSALCETVLLFLNATLKHDEQSVTTLRNNPNIQFKPAQPAPVKTASSRPEFSLSGRVLTPTGEPIPGVRFDYAKTKRFNNPESDDQGRFTFTTPSRFVVLRKLGFLSQKLDINASTELNLTLQRDGQCPRQLRNCSAEVSRYCRSTNWHTSFCLPKQSGVKRTRTTFDVDYGIRFYRIKGSNGFKAIRHGEGGSWSQGTPGVEFFDNIVSFEEVIYGTTDELSMFEARGTTRTGKKHRFLGKLGETLDYLNVDPKEAAILDRLLDSACLY